MYKIIESSVNGATTIQKVDTFTDACWIADREQVRTNNRNGNPFGCVYSVFANGRKLYQSSY